MLAVTITRDPAKVAAIDLAAGLPWFFFALIAGALVDRMDRRVVMVCANIFRAALMTLLGIAVLTESESLLLLYVIAFLLGMAETMFDNSAQAIMPALVDRSLLEKANGRLYAAELTANQFAGPPLGGLLFAAAAAVPFLLDAGSFAISALLIFLIRGGYRAPRDAALPATRLRTDIAEGLKWLWNHKLLRTLGIFLGFENMMFTAGFSILVLYAIEILELSAAGYGLLLAAGAVGSVIGSFTAAWISKALGGGRALLFSLAITVAGMVAIALTSSTAVTAIAVAVFGLASIVWNVITVSLRQRIIPDRLLGRVNSAYRLLGWGTMPIGAALGGLLARAYGLRAPFWVGAAVYAVLTVLSIALLSNSKLAAAQQEAQ